MCLAFALLDQQCVSSQGVLEVKNCALAIRKQLERCQTADFWIMVFEILIGLRMEVSTTNIVRKLVLLHCKSTQLAVQLHHEGKLYSTCLIVN